MSTFNEDVRFSKDVSFGGTITPPRPRSELEMDELKPFVQDPTGWRVHDAVQTNLPGTAGTDDLELTTGTLGTAPITVQSGDLKAAGATTRYARRMIRLEPEYQDGQTITLRFVAGMLTTVSDGTATLDAQVYSHDGDNTVSADICATAAQSINSLIFGNIDFTITPTGLVAGDLLDVRIAMAINDGATGTAVIGCVDSTTLLCDIRG